MSILRIELKDLMQDKVTPNELLYLMCRYQKKKLPFKLEKKEDLYLESLQEKGFIKILKDPVRVLVREVAFKYFSREVKEEQTFEQFVEEFRDIFGDSGRTGIKGSKTGCREKMKKFVAQFPEYSRDDILLAATNYVESQKENGFKYLQQADYFISKKMGGEFTSRLETYLEELDSSESKENLFNVNV